MISQPMSATLTAGSRWAALEQRQPRREQEAERGREAEVAPAQRQRLGADRQEPQQARAEIDADREQDRHPVEPVGVGAGEGEERGDAGEHALEGRFERADERGDDGAALDQAAEVERQLVAQACDLQP